MDGSDWYKSVASPQVPDQQRNVEVECVAARVEIADIDPPRYSLGSERCRRWPAL